MPFQLPARRRAAFAAAAVALALAAGPARADEDRTRYLLLGVAFTQPDGGRAAKYGLGGGAGYAHLLAGTLWIEGRVFATVLEADAPGVEAFSQEGLGLDALFPFGPAGGPQPFLLLGGGAIHNDVAPDALDGGSAFVNAGAGWRSGPAASGGLRYRIEVRGIQDGFDGGQTDVLLGLGIEFGGAAPIAASAPPAPLEPARTVRIEPAPQPVIADADGDGVPDEDDQCPQTLAGAKVERDGCVWQEQVVTMSNIRFEPGASRLTADSRTVLDSVAGFFAHQPDVALDVYGHTDAQGAEPYNLRLSADRAASVRAYLVGKGIAAERLKSEGFGESRPIADNATAEGRARNRRVELHIHARQPR